MDILTLTISSNEQLLNKYPKIDLSFIISNSPKNINSSFNRWNIQYKSLNYTMEQKLEIVWHIHNELTPPPTSGKYSSQILEDLFIQRKIYRCAEFGIISNIYPNKPLSIEEYFELVDFASIHFS